MKKKQSPITPSSISVTQASKPEVKKSKILLYFIIKFAVFFLLFEACYFNDYLYNHIFFPINKLFAFEASKVLSLIGIPATSSSESISNGVFSISVKQGCDSIEALAIFVCGVLAFPSAMKVKLLGLLYGSLIILCMNLIRLVHLFWIGLYHHDLFDLFHLEIWQGFFIILSIVLWILWVLKAVKPVKISGND